MPQGFAQGLLGTAEQELPKLQFSINVYKCPKLISIVSVVYTSSNYRYAVVEITRSRRVDDRVKSAVLDEWEEDYLYPRGCKYPMFMAFGPKSHSRYGFWDQGP